MITFDNLPRMMVAHLLISVILYVNDFLWTKGVLKTLNPLTIVEGMVLNSNLIFRVKHGEFVQTFKGT